jgi:hypothetical protein
VRLRGSWRRSGADDGRGQDREGEEQVERERNPVSWAEGGFRGTPAATVSAVSVGATPHAKLESRASVIRLSTSNRGGREAGGERLLPGAQFALTQPPSGRPLSARVAFLRGLSPASPDLRRGRNATLRARERAAFHQTGAVGSPRRHGGPSRRDSHTAVVNVVHVRALRVATKGANAASFRVVLQRGSVGSRGSWRDGSLDRLVLSTFGGETMMFEVPETPFRSRGLPPAGSRE